MQEMLSQMQQRLQSKDPAGHAKSAKPPKTGNFGGSGGRSNSALEGNNSRDSVINV